MVGWAGHGGVHGHGAGEGSGVRVTCSDAVSYFSYAKMVARMMGFIKKIMIQRVAPKLSPGVI